MAMRGMNFAMLMLALLLGVAMQAAAQQPTMAPTSAPTAVIDDQGVPTPPPSPLPTLPPLDTEPQPTSAPTTVDDGEEDKGPKGPKGPKKPKTQFTSKIAVSKATDFDETKYLQALAATMGVEGASVAVKSIDYVVAVDYTFAADMAEADVKTAVASMQGVAETAVSIVTPSRRLRGDAALRRLASTVAVEIKYDSPAAADAGSTKAADTTALASLLGVEASSLTASAPTLEVVVVTEVVSDSDTAVSAPDPAALSSKMEELQPGVSFTVAVADVVVTDPPGSSPTGSPGGSSSTSASDSVSSSTSSSITSAEASESSGAEKVGFGGVLSAMLAVMLFNSF